MAIRPVLEDGTAGHWQINLERGQDSNLTSLSSPCAAFGMWGILYKAAQKRGGPREPGKLT